MRRYKRTDGQIWSAQRIGNTAGTILLKRIEAAKRRPRDPRQYVRQDEAD